MFSHSFVASAVALLAAVSQVQAHAFISPGLGVSGTGVRNDVQRPSTGSPCGNANLAAIDTSTAAVATNGLFNAVATNFNAGADGSTALKSATVDITGTGKSFTGKVTIVKNGVAAPATVAPANLQLQLPAGTVCQGGKTKNLCLVSVVTNAGFGNCLVVSTGAAKAAAPPAAPPAGGAAAVAKSTSAAVKATSVAAAAVKTTTAPAVACTTPATTGAIGKGAAAVAVPPAAAAPAAGAAAAGAKHHHHHNKSAKAREDSRNARTLVESMRRNVQVVRRFIGGVQA